MNRTAKTLSIRQRIKQITPLANGEWLGVEDIASLLGEKKVSVQGTMGDLVERGDMKRKIVRVKNRNQALYALYLGISPCDLLSRKWADTSHLQGVEL